MEPKSQIYNSSEIYTCRLCGMVIIEDVVDIFNGSIDDLHEKINKHLPITIQPDDGFSIFSCMSCANTLLSFDQLVLACIAANKRLQVLNVTPEIDLNTETVDFKDVVADSTDNSFINENASENNEELFIKFNIARETFCSEDNTQIDMNKSDCIENDDTVVMTISINSNINSIKIKECSLESDSQVSLSDFVQETIDGKIYYKCNTCEKRLHSKNTCISHIKIHTGERPYICDFCGKQFRFKQSLQRHTSETHNGIKKFACDFCGRKFATKWNVMEHKNIHTTERPYICAICGKSFKQKATLFCHNRIHKEHSYQCEQCNQAFPSSSLLNRHIRKHTGEKPYTCEICGKAFRINSEMKRHKLIHSDTKPFKCNHCSLTFRMKRYMNRHIKLNHNNTLDETINKYDETLVRRRRRHDEIQLKFFCDECDNGYTRKFDLEKHQRLKHNKNKPQEELHKNLITSCKIKSDAGKSYYKCNICFKTFLQSFNLLRHYSVHSETREFCCHLCGKHFKVAESLQRHIKISHDKVRDFQCEVCDKKFSTKQSLCEHHNTHTNNRPYVCDICGSAFRQRRTLATHKQSHSIDNGKHKCLLCHKVFKTIGSLKSHQIIHSDIKPYKCFSCGKDFKTKNIMDRHSKTHETSTDLVCDICGKIFKQDRYLSAHKERHNVLLKKVEITHVLL